MYVQLFFPEDDGSPDGTAQAVEEFGQKEKRAHLLKRTQKNGLGPAYVAGFKWGLQNGYDFISEMDADWSHPPRFLTPLYQAAQKYARAYPTIAAAALSAGSDCEGSSRKASE